MKRPDPQKKKEKLNVAIDVVNEAIVMAAVLTDDRARKKYLSLPADYFFGPGHRDAWLAIREMYDRGLEYSPEALRSVLHDENAAKAVDEYVARRQTSPRNLKHFVEALRWDKVRADAAMGVVPAFLEALRDQRADPTLVRSLAGQVRDAFAGSGSLRYLRSASAVAAELDRELTARREGRAIYPFGVPALDLYGADDTGEVKLEDGTRQTVSLAGKARLLPGLAPKGVTAITGVSGSGKTSFTGRVVVEQIKRGRRVLWGAWEQHPSMSLELAGAIMLGMSRSDLMSGQFAAEDQRDLVDQVSNIDDHLAFFELPFGRVRGEDGKNRFALNDAHLDLIHQYVADSGCDVFVGDVFKYALEDTRPDEEDKALKRCRAIAAETGAHMVLINHLSLKEVERREDKRPTRDALMGSTGWVNVPDTVIGVHNRSFFESVPNDRLEFHILKQRYGRFPQVVEVEWEPEYAIIGEGRTIELARPGERSAADEFLEEKKPPRFRGKRKRAA